MAAHVDNVPPYLAPFARVCVLGTVFFCVPCFAAALAYSRLVYWHASAVAFQVSRSVALLADGLIELRWALAAKMHTATPVARFLRHVLCQRLATVNGQRGSMVKR